jgi:hypothetical protein
MIHDFMLRMFSPILWQDDRAQRPQEEPRPLSFAKLRGLFSCRACESCCGQAV